MKRLLCAIIFLISGHVSAEIPSGESILKKVDANIGSDNKIVVSQMTIEGRRGTRTVKSKSWIQGREKSFTEYIAPAREKGTKMLKLDDQLWTYSPSTDRIIKISGHMLRQSVMGSDLSYEDMMEDPKLQNLYDAEVIGEDTLLGRPCWVLELTARKEGLAYHSRRIRVDKERFVVLREDRHAKSGKILKTTEVQEIIKVQNRWLPKSVVFKDVLKLGNGTRFVIESIEFDVSAPEHIFSKAALRK
ncbi:MAG: outer membrane lipoprotein-sorting protein [Candidatus Zixiibacteriota bacterium]|nr:MAG: outer membrane lipoprotein-sorting protein [candidate division Zixibacteria bacterium]